MDMVHAAEGKALRGLEERPIVAGNASARLWNESGV